MNNQAPGLTRRTDFVHIPTIDNSLLEVRAGIPADVAAGQATCLAESIRYLANDAVNAGEMRGEVAYLVEFAADAIFALTASIAGAYPRKTGDADKENA